ncbi:hypothetical protein G0Q06_05470 [Puniceicoccales bacterium CK1056]|uniref:Yeast cell wall synthesis Kre9/Knh1-like N-terminal domain-containing protein n=1 Tax=Oceanipulchritudo coccoides TaxID=2706888 RepID=A0A6B2LZM0_9BACT|nr:Ser-Thr-rich GPI-anchored membrane family protein [Oceanipulchritudo coccoides]NDV61893.1 hypothetical protein [Oceanipulchritudo coccoides]
MDTSARGGSATPESASVTQVSQKEAIANTASNARRLLPDIPQSTFRQGLLELDTVARAKALGQFNDLEIPIQDSSSLRVGSCGSLHYACSGVHHSDASESVFLEFTPQQSEALALTAEASVPVSQPPVYHSKPGAPYAIYLDFNGGVISGTLWNSNYNSGADYDTYIWTKDSDSTTFSDAEQAIIREIWQRISEDYAPFNVNVTTDPSFDPDVTGGSNSIGWILFTRDEDKSGTAMPAKGAGGVAWLNVFGSSLYASNYSPALVYADNLGPNVGHFMAEAGSHEMGHNMGLAHDGSSTVEYYAGHGSGETEWAPIMGSSYYENVTTWSKGDYLNANNTQDDINIITGKVGSDPDVVGDTRASATPLSLVGNSIEAPSTEFFIGDDSNEGIIQTPTDKDFFSFETSGGPLSITVDPFISEVTQYARGNNLDLKLTLFDSAGNTVAVADPTAEVAASLNLSVTQGAYTISIEGTGSGNPLGDPPSGYTSYGSLGMYFISGTIPQDLSVASPALGATWQPGLLYEIIWGGTVAGQSVDLDLYRNGSFVQSIVSNLDGANSSTLWTVPSGLEQGSGYTVRVSVDGVTGTSDSGIFEIREVLPVVAGQAPSASDLLEGPQTSVTITFNETMDPASFTITDDVASFTGPQAVDLSSSITGFSWSASNTVLTISFNALDTTGFYRMVMGPEILDTNGNPLDQDGDLLPGEAFEDQYALIFEITEEIPGGISTVYTADMSSNPGASTDPGWAWGVPSQGGLGGPNSAYTGNSVLGYNLSGQYEPGIVRKATLPAIATTGKTQVQLQFRRWLGVSLKANGSPNSRHADYARVEYSTNGTSWTSIWENSTEIVDTGWALQSFSLPASAENQESLLIRFVIESDGQSESFGWNIDDIEVLVNTPSQTVAPPPPVVICHTPNDESSGSQSALFFEYSQPMDPGSFSLGDISQFDGPNGSISSSGFEWISSTLLRVDFPEQSVDGNYSMVLNPTVADTYGQLVDQDLDLTGGESIADQYTASFSINNSPGLSPPESWRLTYFETTLNEGVASDEFDFDRDGLANVMERAFGTLPTDGGNAYRPIQSSTVVEDLEYLTFQYRRLAGGIESGASGYSVDDLVYVVETSQTLGASSWSPVAGTVESRNTVNGVETVTIRLNSPMTPGARKFIRLNVTSNQD